MNTAVTPPRALGTAAAVVLSVVYIVPLSWIVLTAFKSDAQILSAPNAPLFTPTLETFRGIGSSGVIAILNSLQIAGYTTLLAIACAVSAAYALSKPSTRRWTQVAAILLGALLVLQMVPQPMAVIPLYSILADWGLVGTLVGLILADVALLVPFSVLLLRPFVMAIPGELYDAAQVDGASSFQTFRLIVLPLLVNGIITIASIVFIISWGEFIYATTLLTEDGQLPVSALLAQQTSLYSVSWNRLMGLALLTSLPLILLFIVAQRRLVHGLSVGAVK